MSQQQRTRNRQRQHPRQGGGPDSAPADALDSMRNNVQRLFSVMDRAYDRVRAEDSAAYLRANRQTGGQ